ncbi:hypothetical protein [Rhodohalobacter sp. SW132]|uniref:hypothetical protein n=1 Tax=Rhodohalobacter sp. SW132 TaxID=2293433 RepID=UPI0011C0492D|nr:hypothetical protein [Rhodohalobacter sp. SW132]
MKSPVRPLPFWSKLVLLVVITAAGLLWTGMAGMQERVVVLRMFLFFGSALIAFITPYLLFPDPAAPLMQLGNAGPSGLIRHLVRRVSVLLVSTLLFIAVICFGDIHAPINELAAKAIYFLHGSLFFSGLLFYSVIRYTRSGKSSQFWKESDKGKKLRSDLGEYFKYPIDPGAIPSFINTVVVGALGMIAVSAGAALYGSFGLIFELIPALILVAMAAVSFSKLSRDLPSNYYASTAFFNEFFGETVAGKEQEGKVEVFQLWWVPRPIKSHVWAMLLQLDRKFPAGRVLLAGHLLIWILSYQRPGDELMITAWLLFSLFHHIIIVISLSDQFSPAWFQRWIGSAAEWIFARIWIQFRWILILAVSMLFNSWIFGHVSYSAQAAVLLFYIGSATVISLVSHFYKNVYS